MEKVKVIGSGGYGCVVTPPLPCKKTKAKSIKKTTKSSKVVGKLMTQEDADIELSTSELIKSIPGYERYFIVEEQDSCDASNFSRFRQALTNQCSLIHKSSDTQLVQLLAPYGGRSLRKLSLPDSFNYLDAFRHVLEGIAKLNGQGICHFDIKEDNLLLDPYGTIRIIDFGISFRGDQISMDTVRSHQFAYAPEYPSDPPEIALQRATYRGIETLYAIQNIMNRKPSLEKAELLLGLKRSEQQEALRKFWVSDITIIEQDWVEFFHTYWRKWDAWAVGVVFLNLLKKMLILPGFVSKVWMKEGKRIRPVLKGLLMANPKERLTAEEALTLLNGGV